MERTMIEEQAQPLKPPQQHEQTQEIILYPEEFLRRKAAKVKEVNDAVKTLAQRMAITLLSKGGAGLAAPQVGYSARIVVMNLTGDPKDCSCFINPEIMDQDEELVSMPERCLSIPKVKGNVMRPANVVVKFMNLEGKELVTELKGWAARVMQHEIDHLDGVLFIDHLKGVQKTMAANKLKKLRKAVTRHQKANKEVEDKEQAKQIRRLSLRARKEIAAEEASK
jgi:peptide deformylase